MSKWATGLIFLFAGCLGPQVRTTAVTPAHQLPPAWLFSGVGTELPVKSAKYLGKFRVTYYWVVEEKDYPKSSSVPLYSIDGKLVGRFHSSFVRDFKTESAARLRDGRCLSYLKKKDRVQVVERFLGHGGNTLTELKSIAVDPKLIPLGSKVYIPQFEGVAVNGKQLNGVFYAHDVGSAVKGNHIDIFLGDKDYMNIFSSAGVKSSCSVDVYLLE
ncbi:MAG: 3D domain-containing protein [bacterium]